MANIQEFNESKYGYKFYLYFSIKQHLQGLHCLVFSEQVKVSRLLSENIPSQSISVLKGILCSQKDKLTKASCSQISNQFNLQCHICYKSF